MLTEICERPARNIRPAGKCCDQVGPFAGQISVPRWVVSGHERSHRALRELRHQPADRLEPSLPKLTVLALQYSSKVQQRQQPKPTPTDRDTLHEHVSGLGQPPGQESVGSGFESLAARKGVSVRTRGPGLSGVGLGEGAAGWCWAVVACLRVVQVL